MRKSHLQSLLLFSAFALSIYFVSLTARVTAAPTASFGDIIINEIMQNPAAVGDADGEWFEVVNLTGSDIDINGWEIRDDDSDSHIISGAPVVPAVGFYVFCRNSDTATNGGVTCDYEYTGSIALANSADEIVLVQDPAGTPVEIARVSYDGGPAFPDPNGASMEYSIPTGGAGAAAENNTGSNWAEAVDTYGDGDLGTPGAINNDWNPTAVTLQSVDANAATLPLGLLLASVLLFGLSGAALYLHRRQA